MRFLPLAAFLIAFLGWVSMAVSMHIPAVRATLWPTWVICLIAFALGIYSFVKVRPLGIAKGVAATLGVALSGFFFLNYFTGMATPHASGRVAVGAQMPSITIKAEDGKDLVVPTGKPTLLVFYRGFW